MKVYLPAIEGHVSDDIVHTFWAFLEFCYLIHRDVLTDQTLMELQDALTWFHHYCEIFCTEGVCPNGFSLPRQHSLLHYEVLIRLFGAPNGLCTSITESKHIKAVKGPWRHSNRYKALSQMLLTNQCLDKLAASAVDFEKRGRLKGSVASSHMRYLCTSILLSSFIAIRLVQLCRWPWHWHCQCTPSSWSRRQQIWRCQWPWHHWGRTGTYSFCCQVSMSSWYVDNVPHW